MKYKNLIFAILFLNLNLLSFGNLTGLNGLNSLNAQNQRIRYNFNSDWEVFIGDFPPSHKGAGEGGEVVTLPRAFNEDEAFRVSITEHTDTIVWYRKKFKLPKTAKGQKIFLEFEGIRWGGKFYVNDKFVGMHENGVMAFGFDITDFISYDRENVITARIDNSWQYREEATGSAYQWNDRNFYANYGGINKNVYLHVTPRLYQTLPLYSNLKTTGTYIYAREIDIARKSAVIVAESEVRNEFPTEKTFIFEMKIEDMDGKIVATATSEPITIAANETKTVKAGAKNVLPLHFWSWGYGYLYNVYTTVKTHESTNARKQQSFAHSPLRASNAERDVDVVCTRTGFRKTRFANGLFWLNDRVLQIKGYAERSTNEWVAVGQSVPAWLSDYSNRMMVESNANTVRWMHVTPWKQDVESCDRMGLIQLMPAGDSEKDVEGRRWEQRVELMRDAIIYNRNNPSIIFYESGNESISEEHIAEMKALRDLYDPYGGRAIGSREMLDSKISEWGGEMLYINKSAHIPMFATEYCRDEALRLYWDDYSYPFHKNGEGSRWYKSTVTGTQKALTDASSYNRNQDSFFSELITRWNDYFRVRPGTGRRVSSGGLKIHFHESNTHWRGTENYRRSGVVDAMRIPKDAFYAHQIMWNGWVDIERHGTWICGHWNYEQNNEQGAKSKDAVQKDVLVCSTADSVVLFVNNTKYTNFERTDNFLFTFKNVKWESGGIKAISYDNNGIVLSSDKKETAGVPHHIVLTSMTAPDGFKADGADLALIQVEVVDKDGRRCPLDNSMIDFDLQGKAQWLGGMAKGEDENYVGKKTLPVECGVNRVLIRSTTKAGKIKLTATVNFNRHDNPRQTTSIELSTLPFKTQNGLSEYISANYLPSNMERGETPKTPSYTEKRKSVEIVAATAGANEDNVKNAFDDNELSEWQNDGKLSTGWIKFELERDATVNQVEMKLTGWRMRSYPIEIYVDDVKVWEGETEKSLGYICLPFKATKGRFVTVKLIGQSTDKDAFGGIVEVAAQQAGELDLYRDPDAANAKGQLRIVEMEVYGE